MGAVQTAKVDKWCMLLMKNAGIRDVFWGRAGSKNKGQAYGNKGNKEMVYSEITKDDTKKSLLSFLGCLCLIFSEQKIF